MSDGFGKRVTAQDLQVLRNMLDSAWTYNDLITPAETDRSGHYKTLASRKIREALSIIGELRKGL